MDSVKSAYEVIQKKQDQLAVHKHELRHSLDEVEQTINLVAQVPDKLEHQVMIPITPLAFMEGTVIHTNEFLCSLGKDYFVWKSAKGTTELLERRKAYLEGKLAAVQEEAEKIELHYNKLKFFESQYNTSQSQPDEMQEIIEFIPEEGDPVLIQGPTPVNTPAAKPSQLPPHYQTENKPTKLEKPALDTYFIQQSEDLDACYREARDQGIIEENEVLVRGEWKRPIEEQSGRGEERNDNPYENQEEDEDEEEEEEMVDVDQHVCNFCGKINVTSKCSRCKTVWYCSRACQLSDWKEHKKTCKEMVKTTISKSYVEPKMPDDGKMKITEKRVVEKDLPSIKPVVIEREYARNVRPEQIEQVEQVERKPKRKSLFRKSREREGF